MALRTTSISVSFAAPFKIKGLAETLPAGIYEVETEEEIIEGNGPSAYRRIITLLYVRRLGMTRALAIDPEALQAALDRDRAAG